MGDSKERSSVERCDGSCDAFRFAVFEDAGDNEAMKCNEM